MKIRSLLSAMLGSPPNTGQVLKDDDRVRILRGELYDPLADHMIGVALKAGFSTGGISERSLCALCPFALKPCSHSPVVTLTLFNLTTAAEDRVSIWADGRGETIHTEVYADDRLGLFSRHLLNIRLENDVKIKSPFLFAECTRANGPIKVLGLLLAISESNFLPPASGAERNGILLKDEPEVTTAFAALQDDTAPEVKGGSAVAVPIAPHRGIGTGDLPLGGDSELSGKAEALTNVVIDSLMQAYIVGTVTHLVCNAADIVQRIAISLHRLVEHGNLFGCWIQFQAGGSLNLHV